MTWFRTLMGKCYVQAQTLRETDEKAEEVAYKLWDTIAGLPDGAVQVAQAVDIPEDDAESFRKRANYFIFHGGVLDLPWSLKYPAERVNPACPACGGTGEIQRPPQGERDDG